jgi:hypothetical protein
MNYSKLLYCLALSKKSEGHQRLASSKLCQRFRVEDGVGESPNIVINQCGEFHFYISEKFVFM